MKMIDAERKVHFLAYDDEHEENIVRYMTVEEMLDEFTDEGCPTTVDPVKHGRWIPCSERLPEKEGIYLCTVCADYRNPREMIYAPDNTFRAEDSDTWMSIDGYRVYDWFVIAWMPLPKPYKMDEVEE